MLCTKSDTCLHAGIVPQQEYVGAMANTSGSGTAGALHGTGQGSPDNVDVTMFVTAFSATDRDNTDTHIPKALSHTDWLNLEAKNKTLGSGWLWPFIPSPFGMTMTLLVISRTLWAVSIVAWVFCRFLGHRMITAGYGIRLDNRRPTDGYISHNRGSGSGILKKVQIASLLAATCGATLTLLVSSGEVFPFYYQVLGVDLSIVCICWVLEIIPERQIADGLNP
jgi:hypothetical protein